MTKLINLEWFWLVLVGDDDDADDDDDNYFGGDHDDDASLLHCGIEIGTPCQGLQAPFSRPDQRILESSAHDHRRDDDVASDLLRLITILCDIWALFATF